jgi:multiple sugar transport system ATP-binding protein
MAEIVIEKISKQYGKVTALRDISLKIGDGESVVLLGPSGCGKTTLLRCIAGLEKPDKGEIFIGGILVNDLTPRDRDLSMVFQNYALFPLKIRHKSQSEISARVNETAKLLQIEDLLDKMPRQLSGGEQQRVAIGRAIAREPKAFLMDEPLSNLDAPTRVQMRTELKKIQKELGATTIYVTHDQSEAMVLADEIGVMRKGELLQYSTPENVYSNPSKVFVASFIGSPPSNLTDVVLESNGSGLLKGSGVTYPLSSGQFEKIRAKTSASEFVFSVRAEDLLITNELAGSAIATGEVSLIEPLGGFALIDVMLQNGIFFKVSVARDNKLSLGDKVGLKTVNENFHLFEKSTGNLVI